MRKFIYSSHPMYLKWSLNCHQYQNIELIYSQFVILIINVIIDLFIPKTLSSFYQLVYNFNIIMCRWIFFKKCRWVVFNCVDELSPKTVSMSCLVDELSCSHFFAFIQKWRGKQNISGSDFKTENFPKYKQNKTHFRLILIPEVKVCFYGSSRLMCVHKNWF